MFIGRKTMEKEIKELDVSKVVKAAMDSNIIDKKMTIEEMTTRLGGSIDEVAGYVLAWEKYVLVVGKDVEMTPTITMKRSK